MAETISELTGEDREKRIAELKRKMQAAAKKAKAAHEAGELGRDASPAQSARPAAAPQAAATAVAPAATKAATVTRPARETPASSGNGAAAPSARPATPRPVTPRPQPKAAAAEQELSTADMNRREFLTYAWVGAIGLLTLETGVASYFFMYPRFRAGEFGGEFFVPESSTPDPSAPPQPFAAGKFWLVTTQEGDPKALYMVCTHLGCLYKWEQSNNRFECPCHGSKFSHDGFYIEGPAPRSLDSFDLRVEGGELIVDTGNKITGNPSSESPARHAPV